MEELITTAIECLWNNYGNDFTEFLKKKDYIKNTLNFILIF